MAKNYEDVKKQAFEIAKNYLTEMCLPKGIEVTLESRFVEDLVCDSLDCVELELELEDEFGIRLKEDPFEDKRNVTIGQIVEYVAKKVCEA